MAEASTRHGGFPQARTAEDIARNLGTVRARIRSVCRRVGRHPDGVRLLPVSKTVDEQRIRYAHAAGRRSFGENRVQEMKLKADAMPDLDVAWSVIGHLQTNKAKHVARLAAEFQALDRLKLAEVLDRRLQIEGRSLDVHVQINSSGESSKFGVAPDDALVFVRALSAFTALRVRGLMTLAVLSADATRVRGCFRVMREVQERLRQDAPAGVCMDDLSMGMSGDYEIAIEEGATVVRVGQAIFGARPLPDSYYWPGAAQ